MKNVKTRKIKHSKTETGKNKFTLSIPESLVSKLFYPFEYDDMEVVIYYRNTKKRGKRLVIQSIFDYDEIMDD